MSLSRNGRMTAPTAWFHSAWNRASTKRGHLVLGSARGTLGGLWDASPGSREAGPPPLLPAPRNLPLSTCLGLREES